MADIDTPPAAPSGHDELLSPLSVGAYLEARGLITDAGIASARELGGGVSNVVLAVDAGARRLVVKQALPRLRVEAEWLANRERTLAEAAALEFAASATPGAVPAVVDLDRERCVLTIAAAPAGWTTWKARLLAGEAEPAVAVHLAGLLASWHGASARDATAASVFRDREVFEQLRVDAYYRTVGRRRPELAAAIAAYVEGMEARSLCLVHGDYSPKNVLVGQEGMWVIDFEVAHFGDPVFDLAFMLNHLLLKQLHLGPEARVGGLAPAFLEAYRAAAPPELVPETRYLLGHLGCLMVARVEGKSPLEYLTAPECEAALAIGTALLLDPPGSLAAVVETVERAAP